MKKSYFFKSVVLLAVMLVSCFGKVSAQTWQRVDISELAPGDVFVIVDISTSCAMPSNAASSSPTAVAVTLNAGQDQLEGEVADNLKWNISGNSTDGYVFYPNGETESWLYCTNSNTGVRVGSNGNKFFVLTETNWLENISLAQHRYIGVYSNADGPKDWRCYTNHTGNIANTQTRFFRYTEEVSSVETPVISPNGGIYYEPQTVTISCATDGAVIHYTLDGTLPDGTSAVYSEPLTISATTTVKAIAIVGEDASNVATATYTLPVEVATIAELRSQSTGSTLYRLTGEAVVSFTGSYRHHKYIQDATAGVLIDDNSGIITSEYAAGDGMTGLVGTLTNYRNMLEFVPATDPGEATSHDHILTPVDIDLDADFESYEAQLVALTNVTVGAEGTFAANTDYPIVGSENVNIRLRYTESPLVGTEIPSAPQNVTALVYQYDDTYNLVLISLEEYIPEPTECENVPEMGACTAELDERDMLFTGQVAVDDTLCTLHEYGFVYSVMNTEPELNDDLCTTVVLGTTIEAGEEFSYRLAELGYDTYYVRAFATNEVGTGYSEVASVQQAVPEEYTVHFVVSGRTELEAAPTLYFREGQDPLELPVIDGCENLAFAGWTLLPFEGQTTEAPALVSSFVPVSDTTFYAVFSSTQNLVDDEIVISRSSFAEVAGYGTDDQWTAVSKNVGTEITGWCDLHTNNATMQMRVNTPYGSYPYNVTALPGNITSISMYAAGGGSARQWTPWLSSSPLNKENHQTGNSLETKYLEPSSSVMWNVDAALNANYFYIELYGGAAYVDSIVVVYAGGDVLYTMSAVDTVIINHAICEGMTYEDAHFSTGEEGTHTYLQTNGDYCATQYILNLSVNAVDHVEFAETACDSYTWNNEVYTESGDYVQMFTNANGCDSVVTLHLTINSSDHAEFAATACISYVWNEEV
ncbi:MAG: chitobiase/beta-hexosaminidase C-terminal domain-containing protein, partial [Bacteroidales bacterium]|nr:chitobiase/beta-hexosaminidase C-terminal domain-containing protein [Bacteroidales bacterium]